MPSAGRAYMFGPKFFVLTAEYFREFSIDIEELVAWRESVDKCKDMTHVTGP